MSSEVDGVGIIAAPVVLPVAVAFGAGWLAWQGGKLLVEANQSVNRQIAEKKRQLEEAARHRKMAAIAAHEQLVDMCSQILAELYASRPTGSIANYSEIEQLKYDLNKICSESLPDDVVQIESITSLGYLKLDKIIQQQEKLASFELTDSDAGLYRGLSVADLMADLRIAIEAMDIRETFGKDVKAVDPIVLERIELNESFANITNRIMMALESVDRLSKKYSLTNSAKVWFQSCFNGVDVLIETLCKPTTSNKDLKKGIRRLEEYIEQYEVMAPSIEHEAEKMVVLYSVYEDTARVLGEKVERFQSFGSSKEIETQLRYLQKRADKAQECAAIYQKLGATAYMCYAWDQELQSMGYEVHTRQKIMEMARKKPTHAKLGENKLPFYRWSEEELTQLYSITSECSLQVVVHDDGVVSMQTIANEDNPEAVSTQHNHCAQLKELHERLRKNWFILYDFEERESPDKVTTVAKWMNSEEYAWREDGQRVVSDERNKGKILAKTKQAQ